MSRGQDTDTPENVSELVPVPYEIGTEEELQVVKGIVNENQNNPGDLLGLQERIIKRSRQTVYYITVWRLLFCKFLSLHLVI